MSLRSLLLAALVPVMATAAAPRQHAPDMEATTATGGTVRIFSQLSPLQINRIHSWHIAITDADGEPVSEARIAVTGGMPDHDHGLPTQALVTAEIEPGIYLLEGMRFHMPGRWQIQVSIDGAVATVFDVLL